MCFKFLVGMLVSLLLLQGQSILRLLEVESWHFVYWWNATTIMLRFSPTNYKSFEGSDHHEECSENFNHKSDLERRNPVQGLICADSE